MFAGLASSDSEASDSEQESLRRLVVKKPVFDDDEDDDSDEEEDTSEDEAEADVKQAASSGDNAFGADYSDVEVDPMSTFAGLVGTPTRSGYVISEGFVEAMCASFGVKNFAKAKPTEVQRQCWHALLTPDTWDRDMIAIARTGSGKTLAFLVPVLAELATQSAEIATKGLVSPSAIVLSPTRELARQTFEAAEIILKHPEVGIRARLGRAIGGDSFHQQRAELIESAPQLIIATPGRLLQLCVGAELDEAGEEGTSNAEDQCILLDEVSVFVLDEADRMLDMGFFEAVHSLRALMSKRPRIILTSATWEATSTMESTVKRICSSVEEPIFIGVDHAGLSASRTVTQTVEVLKHKGAPRFRRLVEVLQSALNKDPETLAIVFALFKAESKKLAQDLREAGIKAEALNGDMSQTARQEALRSFKHGESRVLVATDVAARGLDVPGVSLVVNFTMSMTIEDYVHRIGRCGRAGRYGHAVTFFLKNEDSKIAPELLKILEDSNQQVPVDLRIIATKESKRREKTMDRPASSGGAQQQQTKSLTQDEIDRLEQQRLNREKQLNQQRNRDVKSGKINGKGRHGKGRGRR